MNLRDYSKYFYGTICPVCLQHPVSERGFSLLRTCSVCGLVSYCSAAHQREHWPHHKAFCKALRKILAKMNATKLYSESLVACHFQDWNAIRLNILLLCELELKRKLTACEIQMLLFPRVCNVCHTPHAKLLRDCWTCLGVSYCSVRHEEQDKERHARDCGALKLCFLLDTTQGQGYHYSNGNISASFKNLIYNDTTEILSSLKSASFLFKRNMSNFVNILETDILSCPMTVVYAAYRSLCSVSNSLSIEFVGASEYETSHFCKWEELLHWFPNLNDLHLSFIGPELPCKFSEDVQCCDYCVVRNVQMKFDFYPSKLYSSFVKERRSKPDLIVAFNCGFGEFLGSSQDTWSESIPFMLQRGIPLAITSYTLEEAMLDLKCVREVNNDVSVIVECEKNDFGSQRPHRDWEAREQFSHSQVFYKNNFLSIFFLAL